MREIIGNAMIIKLVIRVEHAVIAKAWSYLLLQSNNTRPLLLE